jgi:hypothetical protein
VTGYIGTRSGRARRRSAVRQRIMRRPTTVHSRTSYSNATPLRVIFQQPRLRGGFAWVSFREVLNSRTLPRLKARRTPIRANIAGPPVHGGGFFLL